MAPHRYWALSVEGSPWMAMRELEMRGSIGGADLTGAASYIGTPLSLGGSSALFDNNIATAGGTTGTGDAQGMAIMGCDFGSPVDVVEVAITTYTYSGYRTNRAWLGYSDDGKKFTWLGPRINLDVLDNTVVTTSGFFELVSGRVVSPPARLNTSWPSDPLGGRVAEAADRWDSADSGPLSIAGTVKIKDDPDMPVARRVRLFDQASGRLVRETWSDANGHYAFNKIADRKYFLVSHDHTLVENAAIKDQISPQAPT